MATTMTPPTAAPIEPAKRPTGELRFVAVRAHLLPGEVLSGRQVDVARKRIVVALIAVVVLLAGGYGYAKWQTHSANNDLASAQSAGVSLQSEQDQFSPLVHAQGDTASIQAQLGKLMVGDLSWKTMLSMIRAKAPHGVELTSISGTITPLASAGSPAGGTSAVLNTSGSMSVGQLTINGTAPDKRTVAAYADALASAPGVTAPLISNVAVSSISVTFSISAVITTAALGGRYTAVPPAAAGATGGN